MAFDFVFFLLGDEGDDDALDLMSAPPSSSLTPAAPPHVRTRFDPILNCYYDPKKYLSPSHTLHFPPAPLPTPHLLSPQQQILRAQAMNTCHMCKPCVLAMCALRRRFRMS